MVRMKIGAATMEIVWRRLKKLKIELPYDPAIPFLDMSLEKTIIWKDTWTSMFIATLFAIAKTWKHVKNDRWMDKEDVVYIHNTKE